MPLRIYNTLSKTVEDFKPIVTGKVGMYTCGPTVYNNAHIGNFRTVVMSDLVRRSLEYLGYEVKQVMNITDVDDKIISKAKEEGKSPREIAEKYEKIFLDDIDKLNVLRPSVMPHATKHITDMIDMIKELISRGFAKGVGKVGGGVINTKDSVYMEISKVKDYGKLLGETGRLALTNQQGHPNDVGQQVINLVKDNPGDFALWKFYKDEDGDTVFDAPFGRGRPGWHIECSAMAMKTLGETFDIHAGGMDMIFPHHTNEIAQSESLTGVPLANYWMHYAFVNIAGDKMSKSKQNFYTLDDLVAESVSPLAYRFWLLQAHYRSTVDFTFEAVKAAQQGLLRLIAQYIELEKAIAGNATDNVTNDQKAFDAYHEEFRDHIEDDFDIPGALATVWKALKDSKLSKIQKRDFLLETDRVLGLNLPSFIDPAALEAAKIKTELPPEIEALAELRNQARADKDWVKSDALRAEIEARGFTVKDIDGGETLIK